MIAAGDEFSLVIDERGIPWTWGRTDRGQVREEHTDSFVSRPPLLFLSVTLKNREGPGDEGTIP